MQIYTVKEASRKAKIGVETLKRALNEGLINANRLANGERHTIFSRRTKRSVQRATGINHQQITRVEKATKIAEARMNHAVIRTIGNHQAHLVARKPTRLWWFARLKFWRKIEV